jgi:hypothetical protein
METSIQEQAARFTAHTSFDDPNSRLNAAPRESVEVRALVLWPLISRTSRTGRPCLHPPLAPR